MQSPALVTRVAVELQKEHGAAFLRKQAPSVTAACRLLLRRVLPPAARWRPAQPAVPTA